MNALLSEAKGRDTKQSPSGYTRIVGNEKLGNLISKLQATVISAGNELEKIIWERCNQITDIDSYLKSDSYPEGIWVANKQQIKKSLIAQKSFEPDFVAFQKTKQNVQNCYVIEVKDGDQFDTKKSAGERRHLHEYINFISREIQFTVTPVMCSFNVTDKKQIVTGFKNKINEYEAYTGEELCSLLCINYDEIVNERKFHQKENMHYFITSLLEISEAKEMIIEHLQRE